MAHWENLSTGDELPDGVWNSFSLRHVKFGCWPTLDPASPVRFPFLTSWLLFRAAHAEPYSHGQGAQPFLWPLPLGAMCHRVKRQNKTCKKLRFVSRWRILKSTSSNRTKINKGVNTEHWLRKAIAPWLPCRKQQTFSFPPPTHAQTESAAVLSLLKRRCEIEGNYALKRSGVSRRSERSLFFNSKTEHLSLSLLKKIGIVC